MVVRGVLEGLSAGRETPVGTGTFVSRATFGGSGPVVTRERKNALGGWMRHTYIDLGGRRISGDIAIRPFHEEALQAALGQEVAISFSRFGKLYRVEATRTAADGILRAPIGMLFFGVIAVLFRLLLAVIGGVIVALIVWWIATLIGSAIVGHKEVVSITCFLLAALLPLWLIWGNLSGIVKTFVAWSAL